MSTAQKSFTIAVGPPLGTSGLLTGATVNSSNVISKPIPAGWTLLGCEGFSGGNTHNTCNGVAGQKATLGIGVSITTSFGHGDSASAVALINAQGSGPAIFYGNNAFETIYVSYWEWKDSNAQMNDEHFIVDVEKHVSGVLQESVTFDRFNAGCSGGFAFNSACAQVVLEPQGKGRYGNYYGSVVNYGPGSWHQWEVFIHFNSITGGIANSDGAAQVFLDGNAVLNKSGVPINGTVDMANSSVATNGNYGKSVWTNNGFRPNAGGTCCSGPDQGCKEATSGGGQGLWIGTFNASPINAGNCAPAPPTFNTNVDDIIFLAK